ncbi:MAG: magnesium transporter [Halothiobacillaceae bacterium]|nr:magnesium transporter [Halothiobacillaceae bacterium]
MADDASRQNDVQRLLQEIRETLARNRLVEGLVQRTHQPHQALVENIVHRQNLALLASRLDNLHAADIAHILEALPLDERLVVWDLVKSDRDGEVLLEVSDSVRESLIRVMDSDELVAAVGQLDTDELADLAPDLPDEVMQDVFSALPVEEREQLRFAMSYAEDSVGALMDFDLVSVRVDTTLEAVYRYLRRLKELPDHTDKLFVVDREGRFQGILPLKKLIVSDPSMVVSDLMPRDVVSFRPEDKARDAAHAFERYDLVSAPVIDEQNKLVGRVTIDAVVDFIRETSDTERLSQGGLREEEDIFAPVWSSVKNRGPWLAVNLVTAIIASRVIGLFEGTIEQLVALAALMPIVAGMGGNIGNQTITMIVRALATHGMNRADIRNLYFKEVKVAAINGVVWGGVLALVTVLMYGDWPLGGVMMLAVSLNFLVAALMGVTIPVLRNHFGRDPALGSSVLITAITDSGGFFIFLGLATLFLL